VQIIVLFGALCRLVTWPYNHRDLSSWWAAKIILRAIINSIFSNL